MKGLFNLVIILFLYGIISYGNAQNIEVSGKIVEAGTGEAIPFANIALKEIYKGTASNTLGEFSFKVDSLPVDLVISHLSYEPLEIEVSESTPLVIEMTPGKLLMDELVIQAKGNDEYAYKLIEEAYYKIIGKGNNERYGKAFYRQISKNGDEYSELYEIFYDTKYSNNGVEDWAIQEGRYALKLSTVDSFIYNKNFTLMVRLLTIVQPHTEDLIMPVSLKVREQFYLITDQIISVNNRKVAQIRFEKKEELPYPAMKGEIWIDTESYEVLKLDGTIENDDLKFISLKGKTGSWKNYKVSCEIAFKPLDDGNLGLDYIRLGQNFDYYVNDVFANAVETRSFLSYYEYYTPPKRKNLGGRLLRFNRRDSDMLDNIGYNQLFWDENIIVKRTPIEAEVIADFEEERAFGSIYLNNKDQIVLEDYKMDNDPFIIYAKQQLEKFDLPRKGEKVYIHHDKPLYVTGDKIWFKAYIINMASNIPVSDDGVLYIDLVSPEGFLMYSKLFKYREGKSNGSLAIPENLNSGIYKLEAYTDKMKYYNKTPVYTEDLEILNANDNTGMLSQTIQFPANTLNFYPEGGAMIEGMPAQVGFIAKNIFGGPLDVKGKIGDQEGQQIISLKSEYSGMGSIFMMPRSDIQYTTSISSDVMVTGEFPEIRKSGYSIMVNNLKPNSIEVSVRGGPKLEGKKFYLLVISNGALFDRRIGILTRGLYKAELPKSNLPSGISQILLFDELGQIHAKRLVYLNQPETGLAKYYFAKKEFKRGERIDLVVELNDESGKPLKNVNFSISVLDADKISRNPNHQNIQSYINLGFLLDNKLENPGELFNSFDRETLKKLDWIMLNQKTVLPDIVSFDSIPITSAISYDTPGSITLSGIALLKEKKTPLVNGFVTIVSTSNPERLCWYVKTDEKGRFNLWPFEVRDSLQVKVKANNDQGIQVPVDLVFNRYSGPPEKQETRLRDISNTGNQYWDQFNQANQELMGYDVSDKIIMEQPLPPENDQMLGEPYQTIEMDTRFFAYENLFEVLKDKFPGVTLTENGNAVMIRLSGMDKMPLILVDGFVLFEQEAATNQQKINHFAIENKSIRNALANIEPENIEKIELFKPQINNSNYIMNSEGGIIAIYTKPGKSPDSLFRQLTVTWIPGVSPVEIFPSMDDTSNDQNENIPDLRATLYWNPEITTNRRGRAKIGFYNSDVARNFQMCIEGITEDGIPIFDLYEFGRNAGKNQVY